MENIHFEWDESKNKLNLQKYNINFNEAKTCFFHEYARVIFAPDHSENENRFIYLG